MKRKDRTAPQVLRQALAPLDLERVEAHLLDLSKVVMGIYCF